MSKRVQDGLDELIRQVYTPEYVEYMARRRPVLAIAIPPTTRWMRFRFALSWPLRKWRAWLHRDCDRW